MMKGLYVAALLAGIAPLAAQAQDRDLDSEPSVGKVFSGQVPEGGGTARMMLTLQPGQAIDLTAAPVAGSDPKLQVYDVATGTLLAENDDSAGSLAANVRLFSAQGQRVRIEVTNAAVENSDAGMRFDLIVRPSQYRPKPAIPLTLGETHRGTLASGDEQLFHFTGRRGELWDLSFAAAPGGNLDPALQVFAGEVAGGEAVGEDDDGGGGLNSRLRFLVPENGTYTVRAYGVGSSEGDYTFSAGGGEPAAISTLELGTAATGTLGAGAGEQVYRFSERARRAIDASTAPLIVELRRTGPAEGEGALDPVLEIGFETPLGFSSLLEDDDSGGDSNARLVFDASDLNATWIEALRIKARPFLQTSGAYELVVTEAEGD